MTLDELKAGEAGQIQAVGCKGALRRRLFDMGLTPGTVVYLRRTAPLGDPLELFTRGYTLTLRKEDAKNICVTPVKENYFGNTICPRRQSKQWKNHAFQPAHRQKPARWQFSRRHGRKKRGSD